MSDKPVNEVISTLRLLHKSDLTIAELFPLAQRLLTEDEAQVVFLELCQIDAGMHQYRNLSNGYTRLLNALSALDWYDMRTHYTDPANIRELAKELVLIPDDKE